MRQRESVGCILPIPTNVVETPGEGVAGNVNGKSVLVGGADFVAARLAEAAAAIAPRAERARCWLALAVDGRLVAHIVMADTLREGHRWLAIGASAPGRGAHPPCDRRPARRCGGGDQRRLISMASGRT